MRYWLARGYIVLSLTLSPPAAAKRQPANTSKASREYPGTESDIIRMIDSRLNKLKK